MALGAFGTPSLFDRLDSGEIVVDGENQAGRDLLATGGGSGFSTYTQTLTGVDLADPAVADGGGHRRAGPHGDRARRVGGQPVRRARGAHQPGRPCGSPSTATRHPAGFATVVTFDADNTAEEEARPPPAVDVVFDRLAEQTGATGDQRGGLRGLVDRIIAQVKIDGQRGEGIALPVSFAVMVVVFGGFVAAGFPVIGAVASHRRRPGHRCSASPTCSTWTRPSSTSSPCSALGLCIDYGLLMVSRFREELRALLQGAPVAELTDDQVVEATATTMDRAGRTVVFSALTVAISLAGLMVLEIPFIRAIERRRASRSCSSRSPWRSPSSPPCAPSAPAGCCAVAPRWRRDTGVFSRLAEVVHRVPWVVIASSPGCSSCSRCPRCACSYLLGPRAAAQGHPASAPSTRTSARATPCSPAPRCCVVTTRPGREVEAWAATAADRPGVRVGRPGQPPRATA